MITLRISINAAIKTLQSNIELERTMNHPSIECKNRVLNQLVGIGLVIVAIDDFEDLRQEIDSIVHELRMEILDCEMERMGR